MSYTRSCRRCGQRISLRQMSEGHWVAFDVRTDNPHEHHKENTNYKDYVYQKQTNSSSRKSAYGTKNEKNIIEQEKEEPVEILQNEKESFSLNFGHWIIIVLMGIVFLWAIT